MSFARYGFVLILVTAGAASAQDRTHAREGFYLGAGLGWGNAGADLTVVEKVDRENGAVGNFRLGWRIAARTLLGADFNIWSQVFGDQRWVFNLSALELTYFPMADGGLYVQGGLGLGTSRVETTGFGGSDITQDQAGVGFAVAIGHEWRIAREVSLGPQVQFVYMDLGGDVTTNADMLTVTAQVTWYKP